MGKNESSHQSEDLVAANQQGHSNGFDGDHAQFNTENGDGSSISGDLESILAQVKVDYTKEKLKKVAELLTGDQYTKIMWTAGELLAATFPDALWVVPGLIPAGLSILAGRPKLGKSWLALQIAVACASSGGKVLDQDVQQRKVLYLALEDGPLRLQERLEKLHCPPDATLATVNQWPLLIESGFEHLTALAEHERYELIIIDTLARFGRVRKQEQETMVTERLDALQRWAMQRQVAVLLIDHHRKSGASMADLIDDVMGASSKTGMADAVIGLYRSRGQQCAELRVTGRDLAEKEMAIAFDLTTCAWQLEGEAGAVKKNSIQRQILELIEQDFGGQATCTVLAKALERNKANVRREMLELVTKGLLEKVDEKQGREVNYRLKEPPKEPVTPRGYRD